VPAGGCDKPGLTLCSWPVNIVPSYTAHLASSGVYTFAVHPLRPDPLSLRVLGFAGMRIARSPLDGGRPPDDDSEKNTVSRGYFIQTALLLGSGLGMSVEPRSLQFLPMPMSGVRPRDQKVLLAILAHTVDAVGVAKEFVGISVVKGTLGAVEALLTVVKVRSCVLGPVRPVFLMYRSLSLGYNH